MKISLNSKDRDLVDHVTRLEKIAWKEIAREGAPITPGTVLRVEERVRELAAEERDLKPKKKS